MSTDKRNILGTDNYVLYTQQIFGSGAMAKVILARHRVSTNKLILCVMELLLMRTQS